jgi:hypothetical protein
MRLLHIISEERFEWTEDLFGEQISPYAILSHTWNEGQEVTFADLKDLGNAVDVDTQSKEGYQKLRFCAKQAKRDGLDYFWVDTCCIDKSNNTELTEAINSMFRWYQNAEKCYVYLSDVEFNTSDAGIESSRRWKPAFRKSRWFTRGWTLQELLAPASVDFFSKEGALLGNKRTLQDTIHEITGLPIKALLGGDLLRFNIAERFSWAQKRQTTREEDGAYCLFGIFGVHLPLIYGEGRKNALARLEEQIEKSPNDVSLSLDEEQKRMLIDSLRFDQIDARQMTIRNAHSKTCRWLLKKAEYLDWLNTDKVSEHYGFLWIRGKPGTGKSTLMKFALAHARKTMVAKAVLSFFFNARGENIEKSTIGTYRSLLLQLLERFPALCYIFNSLNSSKSSIASSHEWSIESLQQLLEKAIMGLRDCSVVCFVDALDECNEQQIRDMIRYFEHIAERTVSAGIGFQICFSSRHYPNITIQKGLGMVLEGQEGHSQDIISYLETELKIGQSRIAQQIRREVQEKASGVFMWVVLVVGILNKEHDSGRIHALRRRLQEIPGDLHDLFRDILTRDSHNKDELVLCIQCVLFAKHPLSLEQLYFAILSGVELEAVSRWNSDEITRDTMRLFILDSSKGLTETTTSKLQKDQKVQFIHESVRDFLLKDDGLGNIWPDLRGNFYGKSHERLKQCCLNYMSMDVLAPLELSESISKASTRHAGLREVTAMFPFLEYAVHNVLFHADAAESSSVPQADFLDSFPLTQWVKLDNLFEKYEVRRHTERVSLQYLLAELNMANLLRVRTVARLCLEEEDERYGCALFAAAATGSGEAVQACIDDLKAHVSTSTDDRRRHKQCQDGEAVYKPLGRDFKYSKKRGMLFPTMWLGNETVIAYLIGLGNLDIHQRDQERRTPLYIAAEEGYNVVVQLLVDKGAEVNAQSGHYGNALRAASYRGHEQVVKMLLEAGAEVNAQSGHYGNALQAASYQGHKQVVKMLL